jgi:hypothetical protein
MVRPIILIDNFPRVSLPSITFQPTCYLHDDSRRLQWWEEIPARLLKEVLVERERNAGRKFVFNIGTDYSKYIIH